ncbi:glycosyltransferase family 87 protein [Solirhodobacter olei]|uniref:glycosyltransferase family 87 protein n=1 Tax=Solirhodobacter olei TaxID=2493082 RepID=UPI0013E397CA|nr:glycosyltransferase family 87 protein [Solirhodobacter olei]
METGSVMRASGEGAEAAPPRRPRSFVEWRDQLISAFGPASVLLLAYPVYEMLQKILTSTTEPVMDFQIFHKVGELIWQGRLATAYDIKAFSQIQAVATDSPHVFAPWAYPPQFDLVAALLGLGPMAPSYLLFVGLGLGGFLWLLTRLGPARAGWAFLFAYPAVMVNAAAGQNGFITAILAGLFAIGFLKRDARAGIALGLLVIKPHLAVGLLALVLFRRRYDMLGWAVVSAVASGLLATLAFGPEIWPVFLHGAAETSHALKEGLFPLYRMTSTYAALTTLGVPADAALTVQAALALVVIVTLYRLTRASLPEEALLGLALIASLLVSPYVYDYDMPLYALAMALLAPRLAARLGRVETVLIFAAGWTACSWGVVENTMLQAGGQTATVDPAHPHLSVAGLVFPLLAALILRIAMRPEPAATAAPLRA